MWSRSGRTSSIILRDELGVDLGTWVQRERASRLSLSSLLEICVVWVSCPQINDAYKSMEQTMPV